jgi:hypothetical protein
LNGGCCAAPRLHSRCTEAWSRFKRDGRVEAGSCKELCELGGRKLQLQEGVFRMLSHHGVELRIKGFLPHVLHMTAIQGMCMHWKVRGDGVERLLSRQLHEAM